MAERIAIRADGVFRLHLATGGAVAALRGTELTVREGEIVTLVGPSGSGKTTLLRVLAGLDRPSAGRIDAFGIPLHDTPARALARYRAAHVGIVQQHYFRALSPDLAAAELVALRAALLGWPARRRRTRALELLERVGLADRAGAHRTELSGGEQQRVAVCAALVAYPRLVLADEPTGELDEATGRSVLALLRDLARAHEATVVLVSHDPAAAEIGDRLLRMRDGRILAERRMPDGEELAVVDRGGLVRIDPDLRAQGGIADRARQEASREAVVFRSAGGAPRSVGRPARTRSMRGRIDRNGPPVIVLAGVERHYGDVQALRGIDLTLHAGAMQVLAGPSGSGKTTLLHLIAGLESPTRGSVVVLGRDLRDLSRARLADFRRAHLAIIGQSPALTPFLSLVENVELSCLIRGMAPARARAAALEALRLVGLADRARQRADGLSGGERQRAAAAQAIAARPAILLADEPTAGLDQPNAAAVADLLAEASNLGTTVVCATHDPTVMRRAPVVATLSGGRLGRR